MSIEIQVHNKKSVRISNIDAGFVRWAISRAGELKYRNFNCVIQSVDYAWFSAYRHPGGTIEWTLYAGYEPSLRWVELESPGDLDDLQGFISFLESNYSGSLNKN